MSEWEAGPELDAAIAQHVFGLIVYEGFCFHPNDPEAISQIPAVQLRRRRGLDGPRSRHRSEVDREQHAQPVGPRHASVPARGLLVGQESSLGLQR